MRKPIETENQDGYFACEGCRDERTHEEQDIRVDTEGVCWCEGCYTEEHTWEEWRALKKFVPKLRAQAERMQEALERRDAAILWMFVNGPDGVDGVEKDCYAFAEDAAGEKDRPTDADGIEGYLRMLESHEDFQSCLEAVRRNVKYEALKGGEG